MGAIGGAVTPSVAHIVTILIFVTEATFVSLCKSWASNVSRGNIVCSRWFDPIVQSQSRFHIGEINADSRHCGRESVQAAKYPGGQLFDASRVHP